MSGQNTCTEKSNISRIVVLGYATGLILLLLILRLAFIYWVHGEHYSEMARRQQTMRVIVNREHGDILDRRGIPFTRAESVTELYVFPGTIRRNKGSYALIKALTGLAYNEVYALRREGDPYIRAKIINEDPVLEAAVHRHAYPGLLIKTRSIRYNEHSLARHVIGHLRRSDGRPEMGIEKAFEAVLHPKDSVASVKLVTDALLRPIPGLSPVLSEPDICSLAGDVRLTLDHDIQRIVESVLDEAPDKRRGVVVVEVPTGDILAVASRPHYDQRDPLARLGESEGFLLSIPMQSYPLGSVFKVVVAAAALEKGVPIGRIYSCTGGIYAGEHFYPCRPGGLGEITLRQALAYSCNDVFIRLTRELGGDAVIEKARALGFGESLPVGLPNHPGHLMKPAEYAGPGYGNLALGQGSTLVTPLQTAAMMNVIASGGVYRPLRLVREIRLPSGEVVDLPAKGAVRYVLSPKTAGFLAKALRDVTQYGTGQRAGNIDIGGTAGKTGTPQVPDPNAEIYGWFAGFFPWENPRYTIVVLSKEGRGGGQSAAPIFYEIAQKIWDWEGKIDQAQFKKPVHIVKSN